jgi:heat shock protein HslJ
METGGAAHRVGGPLVHPAALPLTALLMLAALPVLGQPAPGAQRPQTGAATDASGAAFGAAQLPGTGSRLPPAVSARLPATPGDAADSALEGAVWQLHSYRTGVGLKPAVAGDGNSYVAFDEGAFRINAGCDTLRGSYLLEGRRLLFSPHVASGIGDCPPTLRAQEEAVLALLPAVTEVRREDGQLLLLDAERQPLLTLAAPDKSPLQRRLWVLLSYRDRNDLIVQALPAPTFTLRFDDATRLSGVACDDYRGGFIRDERFLMLEGPLAASRLRCGDAAVGRQAEDYLDALSRVDSYRVDEQSLLLRDADGRMIARFTAVDLPAQASSPGIADAGPLPPGALPFPRAPRAGADAQPRAAAGSTALPQ